MIPDRARVPRMHARKTFTGRLAGVSLVVLPGAWIRRVDKQGEWIDDKRDARAALWANLGDVLIVSAKDVANDQITAIEIVSIGALTWTSQSYGVTQRCGELVSGDCWIMSTSGLRSKVAKRTAPKSKLAEIATATRGTMDVLRAAKGAA